MESLTTLAEWRKRLTKAKAVEIAFDEWAAVFELLAVRPVPDQTLDILGLILVTLRQLCSTLQSSTTAEPRLVGLIHEILVPSFQQTSAGGWSLARLLIDSLQSASKPVQARSIDCLSAAAKLSQLLPPPLTSSSRSTQTHMIVPLFRYVINQGADQKWTIGALGIMIPGISLDEVPKSLLDKLKDDMEVSENIAIRSTLITEILKARWSKSHPTVEESDIDFHRTVYEPLLPLFDPSSTSLHTWQNVQRYLYPALSSIRSPSGRGFLQYLESLPAGGPLGEESLFECWVTIASASVQARTLGIRDVDEKRLNQAIGHANAGVRLKAFIICSQNEDLLYEKGIAGLKAGYVYNASLAGTGERSEFGAAVHSLFTHLGQETHSAKRAIERVSQGHKAIKGFEVKDENDGKPCPRQTILLDPKRAVEVSDDLKRHILENWIRPGLRSARRNPVSTALVALIIVKLYVDFFGAEDGIQERVYTRETVEHLISCQASEFTDVRKRAKAILDMATIPLPGYEMLQAPAVQTLLASSISSLAHPRKTQAEAGRSALCLVFTKLVQGREDEVRFVCDLVDQLDDHILASEKDLVPGIEGKPLHGLLAAVRDLVACLDLSTQTTQVSWKPIFHRLVSVVDRVWKVTRPVISLKSTGQKEDGRPDHEIARAYEVANTGDMGAEGDDDEGSDITGLLSGCWRALTCAGELLATIFAAAISSGPVEEPKSQSIWTHAEVSEAGIRFLTWMHEIRHRGTFSKLATAFAGLVQSVKRVPSLANLPMSWLECELGTVRDDTLSTTRRSAALPYSILAIITNDPILTDRAMNSLLEMANVKSQTSDITKVHAFNVLQVCLPDAKQAKFLDRSFERAVMTAIGAFESPNWNVRNVGLILFSTLIHRSLNLAKSQDLFEYRSQSSTRQTYLAWHTKYPSILPYITNYLKNHDIASRSSQHSPLFPMLIIIRSLRHSDNGQTVQTPLIPAVERILASREWQVRKVAGQALASLLSHQEALLRATNWDKLPAPTGNNELHGRLHFLALVIENTIDWSRVDNLSKRHVERNLSTLVDRHGESPLLDITNTVLRCVGSYTEHSKSMNSTLIESAVKIASRLYRHPEDVERPIQGMQLWSSSTFLLNQQPSKDTLMKMLSCSNASPHVQQCPALWALEGLIGPRSYTDYIDADVFNQVLALVRTSEPEDAMLCAMNALRSVPWKKELLDSIEIGSRRGFVRDMSTAVHRTKYVPIREAALPALAWGIRWLASVSDESVPLTELGKELLISSHEDESQPARESALQALTLIPSFIFPQDTTSTRPGLLRLHQTLNRLLHDDDITIREGASEIVRNGLKLPIPICQEKAVELWHEWLVKHIEHLAEPNATSWTRWIMDHILDVSGIEIEERALLSATHQPSVLFEVEPSNLYRDGLGDSLRLAELVRSTGLRLSADVIERLEAMKARIDNLIGSDLEQSPSGESPIDDGWEARRALRVRSRLLGSLQRL